MKAAEFVARFLENHGLRHVFGVSGGASLHLIHGIADATQIKFIPTAHEQGAGFAADSYARLTGLGCAIATSGPGATNLITAIAASFYDSIPTLYITGQVATFRQGARYNVHAYGFQETPITKIVAPITKYARTVESGNDLLWHLEAALYHARRGRPGPVLIDIPDDIQRSEVDPGMSGIPWKEEPAFVKPLPDELFDLILKAQRPVFIWGAGMRPYAKSALRLAECLRIPVATTWGAIDLINYDHSLHVGGFGTHGTRAANFAVQNADLLVCMGCRLDTKATGSPSHFARAAKVVMVDIDPAEILKFEKLGRPIDLGIESDAGDFIAQLYDWAAAHQAVSFDNEHSLEYPGSWIERIWKWKKDYPSKDDPSWKGTRPYALMQALAQYTTPDDIIVSDTGCALGWLMQGFPFKGERMVHGFNLTAMGGGLPQAIGAAFATGRRVILITGDGGLLASVSELSTLARNSLPIKIVLFDNRGHAICRQTQRQWLGGTYPATSIEGGLGFPNWRKTAEAFGIDNIYSFDEWYGDMPSLMVVEIDQSAELRPQTRFGFPIEDMEPSLPREELAAIMEVGNAVQSKQEASMPNA